MEEEVCDPNIVHSVASLSSTNDGATIPCQIPPSSARKRKQMVPKPIRDKTETDDVDVINDDGDAQGCSSGNQWNLTPNKKPVGKMLPLHCIVEQFEQLPQQKEEYAIVSSELVIKDLLKTVLCKIGVRCLEKFYIEGHLQVRNWKPLPFSAICDDKETTIGHLFGEIISHVSLIIKLKKRMESTSWLPNQMMNAGSLRHDESQQGNKNSSNTLHDVATKIKQLIDKRGPSMLVCHGCPFSQNVINQILSGKCSKLISSEKVTAFYLWFNIYSRLADNTLIPAEKLDSTSSTKFMPRRVRGQRTLFDPRYEIPLLFKWYRLNPRPSRLELEAYLSQLNSSERRRNGHPLQYSSLAIWFKNARAKYRDFTKIPSMYRFDRNDGHSLPLNYSQKHYSPRRMIELQDLSQPDSNTRQDPTAQALETLSNVATKVASSLAMSSVSSRLSSLSSDTMACSQLNERYNTVLQHHRQMKDVVESQPNRTSKTTLTVPQPLVPILVGRHQPWQNIVRQSAASNGAPSAAPPTSSIIRARTTTPPAPARPHVSLKGKVSVPCPRKRFNIHPTLEAPRLESWFTVTPKPDREIIRVYATQLNNTDFRRSRDKYTSRIIYVWFKNRRAKQNRLQQRSGIKDGSAVGYPSVGSSEDGMEIDPCDGSDMESNFSGNQSADQSFNYSHGDHLKLESWFQDNPEPTPEMLDKYTNELNCEGSSRGHKMDVEAVSQWFISRRETVTVIKEEPDMYMQPSDDDNSDDWNDVKVRHSVLELLKDLNQTRLAQISPLSQSMISCIANARYTAAISKDKCQEFGRWFRIYRAQTQGFDHH
ncbi:homeobox protein dve-1-like [Antedon mediterranea]|uniref:homeobox protein dve-1-like n=1 Tax=Antedon mediterranea TaxID=105859 RepID=UPI003AF7A1F3